VTRRGERLLAEKTVQGRSGVAGRLKKRNVMAAKTLMQCAIREGERENNQSSLMTYYYLSDFSHTISGKRSASLAVLQLKSHFLR